MSDYIQELYDVILSRKNDPRPGSYTNLLLEEGEDEIVKKIGEEAIEIILAAKGQGNQRIIEESADLIYHLLVLFAARGLAWDDLLQELNERRR